MPAEAATFGTRIRRAFEESLVSLRAMAEGLVPLAATLAPWLGVLAVLLAIGNPLVRRIVRQATTTSRTAA